MFKEYDTFMLTKEREGLAVSAGSLGVVLVVYRTRPAAYEVEFLDVNGRTTAAATLTEEFMEHCGSIGILR